MRKYISEFIGTFFLVLTIVTIVNSGAAKGFEPLAIGAILMAMIFAGGHISGAHYNPAVTLGVFLRGKITLNDSLAYMGAQIVGAIFAAFTAMSILQGVETASDPVAKQLDIVPALLAEFFGTFALVYVVLNVATTRVNSGNSFYGLAIGFTVMAMAYTLGPVSGGAFNPAVALGVSSVGMFEWTNIWVYLVGNFAGAAVAAISYKFLVPEVE